MFGLFGNKKEKELKKLENDFYAAQRLHDKLVTAANLDGWVTIIKQKMLGVKHFLKEHEIKLDKDFAVVNPEITRLFYNNLVDIDMEIDDVKIGYEAMHLLFPIMHDYMETIVAINKKRFNADAAIGPNQALYSATVNANFHAYKQRLEELVAERVEWENRFNKVIKGSEHNIHIDAIEFHEGMDTLWHVVANSPVYGKSEFPALFGEFHSCMGLDEDIRNDNVFKKEFEEAVNRDSENVRRIYL